MTGSGAPVVVRASALSPVGMAICSFTVLRRRRLAISVLLQRLPITAFVTFMVVAVARWLLNPSDEVWLVYRLRQLCGWGAYPLGASGTRRAAPRRLPPEAPRMLLLAQPQELIWLCRAGGECLSVTV